MDGFDSSVMIGLLPITTDWSKLELPHMTLVYAGEKSDLKSTDFNRLAKDAASLALMAKPLTLRVLGVDVFGDVEEGQVDVLILRPTPELLAMRNFVEHWNASKHPFRPHATVGPMGSFLVDVPGYLTFDRIVVGWGDEYLTFWLKH